MARSFTFTVKTKSMELIRILEEKLKNIPDIEFRGNESSGLIKGKGFEGTYIMSDTSEGTSITLNITKKPFIIPWITIQNKLDSEVKKW